MASLLGRPKKSELEQVKKERDSRPDITVQKYQELVAEISLLNNRPNITLSE